MARSVIGDDANTVYLGITSVWEIASKVSIGKLQLGYSVLDLAITIPAKYGYESLPITPQHLDALSRLPLHHRDPFDRLLVAQAQIEERSLVSNDSALDSYGVDRLW